MARRRSPACAFTLIELVAVIAVLAVLIGVLIPAVSSVRKQSQQARLTAEWNSTAKSVAPAAPAYAADQMKSELVPEGGPRPPRPIPAALVKSFAAKVALTPRLSVGTAEPESIYEAKLTATLQAAAPADVPTGRASCEIRLPLPPQIISLADLSVTINGEPSDAVTLRDSTLVWTGELPTVPVPVQVTYAAVGKGLYELQTPPGRILDTFDLDLVANGSDVRMLELSLQPTKLARAAGQMTYTWNYQRLMFGRPISVDVLGVAPVDRLGELRWLGPLSVVVFGLVVGLYAHAHALVRFDRWMLLLILGAFTGAYPLMYFAQEYIPLTWAVGASAGLVLVIVLWRAWTIIGLRHAVMGVLVPASITMALTLVAATHPALQGLILTGGGIVLFLVAMTLIPRIQWPSVGAPVVAAPAV